MLFNSYEYILAFLPLTFFIYFYLNSKRLTQASRGFLVFSSLFFYSWWNIAYLPILLSSMLFNYVIGTSLGQENKKVHAQTMLSIGIIGNVGLLAYFKYADFFIENFNLAFDGSVPMLHLALPLAISFFTFQQIAYLVDSYRGETREYDFLNYAIFVTFFPQLIAGPIVHHKEMMPQFATVRNKVMNYKNIAGGLFIFTLGLFKKVVIADYFATIATPGFDYATVLTFFEAWTASLAYTLQLYFDFSGYTDMAIGAALLFNIKLPINFHSPYKALDIQDFWRRWHITLSRFLRDYIYIPLGGNRVGKFRTYNNLMATFLLGGLWHGAGWTFVFWGFLHGAALVIHRFWKSLGFTIPKVLAWFITFNFINVAWVFFRAKEWDDAIKVLSGMAGLNGVVISDKLLYKVEVLQGFIAAHPENFGRLIYSSTPFSMLLLMIVFVVLVKNTNEWLEDFKPTVKLLIVILTLFIYTLFDMSKVSEFLYFNF
jgi:D-alanyl-lipoteichoic acid acyltransferase DltB (MBOAT superfamily)